jgi:hypothetical protein
MSIMKRVEVPENRQGNQLAGADDTIDPATSGGGEEKGPQALRAYGLDPQVMRHRCGIHTT